MQYSDEELYHIIYSISSKFYELVYEDTWFSKIFRDIDQDIITSQQTDFMVQSFGGPKKYCGRSPKDAHPQIWIDEKIWAYREELLVKAFNQTRAPQGIKEKWLKIDHAFKRQIINTAGPEQCTPRSKIDEIIFEPMPADIEQKLSSLKISDTKKAA